MNIIKVAFLKSVKPTFTLLLTACIQPAISVVAGKSHFRKEVSVRLADYERALQYWLQYEDSRIRSIVLIENSGYGLVSLQKLAQQSNTFNRKIEFIEVAPEPIPEGLHYGYSELEMIDAAMNKSEVLQETDFFVKITGRLYFPELSKLLSIVTETTDLIADSRDYQLGKRKKQYVMTTLLVIRKVFYRQVLMNARTQMQSNGTGHFETLYYNILKPLEQKDQRIRLRFPFNVDPVGVGAHWNVNYTSFSKRVESWIRGVVRFLIPCFRI